MNHMQVVMSTKIQFMEWECLLLIGTYSNNRIALSLIDAGTGEHIARATVNIPTEAQDEDEVFIKDYAENEGIMKSLVEAKVVNLPHRAVNTGYVLVPVCKLCDLEEVKLLKEMQERS